MRALSPDSSPALSDEKISEDETKNLATPVSPGDASKDEATIVHHDLEDFVLPKCRPLPQSEIEPVETFVSNAIQSQHETSEPAPLKQDYRAIADALRRPRDPDMIKKLLISLRTAGNGSTLNQLASAGAKHAQLVHLIFKFNSFAIPKSLEAAPENIKEPYLDYSVADAHLNLLVAMISAKSVHAIPVMSAVWNLLSCRTEAPDLVKFRLHSMLATIMRLCPKTRSELFSVIASNSPFWTRSKSELTAYYQECFAVLRYLPNIRRQVLEFVIDKCLEIDVNIKIMDSGEVVLDEDDDDNDDETLFQLDMEDSDQNKKILKQKTGADVNVLSDKLDCILLMLFKYINEVATDEEQARELFREIIPVFESSILTTHKSKFVQYCIFLLCGLESKALQDSSTRIESTPLIENEAVLHRELAAKLIQIIVDPYRATLTRQSGACYLASFASRASYVCSETVCESVSALLRWAEAYIESLNAYSIHATDSRDQSELHSLFYTVCQAAFYIMCFRGGEAISFYQSAMEFHSTPTSTEDFISEEMPDPQYVDMSSTRWTKICGHELQPLRFCLESVRDEFLHVAHTFELIEEPTFDQLLVESKRLSTGRVVKKGVSRISTRVTLEKQRVTGGVGGLGRGGSNPLNSFFPFDPFLLRRSHQYIEPFYNDWQGPIEPDDIEGDSDDDEAEAAAEDPASDTSVKEDDSSVLLSESFENARHNVQPMSLASSNGIPDGSLTNTDVHEKMRDMERAWNDTLKRSRSHSIENGSW